MVICSHYYCSISVLLLEYVRTIIVVVSYYACSIFRTIIVVFRYYYGRVFVLLLQYVRAITVVLSYYYDSISVLFWQ